MNLSMHRAKIQANRQSTPHVIVIGGGVGGLAAAVRLAAKNVRVTLLEKQPTLGGKLNQWIVPHPTRTDDRPFRFDTGPSLITLPFVFKDLFEAAGRDVRDYLPIVKLDPISRFQWADGQSLEFHSDPVKTEAAIAKFSPGDVAGWRKFFAYGKNVWDLAGETFLANSPEQMIRGDGDAGSGGFDPLAGLRMLSVPLRIGMFRKFAPLVDRHIKSPRLREVLYQYATYSGASPFLCPATLAVIPYCEMHFCGWYIQGGLYTLASALERVARELGVEIRTGVGVSRIVVENGRATGVEVDGKMEFADAVVCNADAVWAMRNLIDAKDRPHKTDAKLDAIDPGGSGLILCLGVEGTYPQLAHHTKFMPADYASDLRAMFETRQVPEDPCIYVCASTRTDSTQAPSDCENLFVLASAPPIMKGTAKGFMLDWEVEGPKYEKRLIETLETKWGLTDLSKRIVVRRRWTPGDLARDYNANAGAIYGISSNGIKNAFLRPANKEKRIAGLFFAGGSTHPGGGLPLVALSGKIAAGLALEYVAKEVG